MDDTSIQAAQNVPDLRLNSQLNMVDAVKISRSVATSGERTESVF